MGGLSEAWSYLVTQPTRPPYTVIALLAEDKDSAVLYLVTSPVLNFSLSFFKGGQRVLLYLFYDYLTSLNLNAFPQFPS